MAVITKPRSDIGSGRKRIGIRQYPATLCSVAAQNPNDTGVLINLPSIPPELTFERTAQFQTQTNQISPDGLIHVYQHTNPLELNYDFSLHFQDEYCENGAVDLVRVASMLHALTLPFSIGRTPDTDVAKANAEEQRKVADAQARNRATIPAFLQGIKMVADTFNAATASDVVNAPIDVAWPPPCRLDIFKAEGRSVRMYGYVKRANVVFKEPWLQVASGDGSYNLPSSANYSFTFVNAPAYRNLVSAKIQSGGIDLTEEAKNALKYTESSISSVNFGQGWNAWVRDHFYDFERVANTQTINPLRDRILDKGGL